MQRLGLIYLLIPIVLIAAFGLAFYGYSYAVKMTEEIRNASDATRRELVEEKVIGIQSEIIDADEVLFSSVDTENLSGLGEALGRSLHSSVLVLDAQLAPVPGGFYTERPRNEWKSFRSLFASEVLPELRLGETDLNQRRHLHQVFDGRPLLFSYTRVVDHGRMYHVVAEVDLSYVLARVFPAFLDVRGPNLYQVRDRSNRLVYGYGFIGVPEGDVVELAFADTLSMWRLRIAPKRSAYFAGAHSQRRTLDLVLIGAAVLVIVVGLAVMVAAFLRERRLSQLKSDFVSNVSHELKTPLSIISMFGELLATGRADSPRQSAEYADIIYRESVRLGRLIDNVLDFAKMERGKHVYEFAEDVNLAEVLERVVEIARDRVEREGMVLEVKQPTELPPLRLDENAITLALLNLVDNSIKYAKSGGRVELAIETKVGRVEIAVRDWGPGIPEDEQDLVFERFYRAKRVRLEPIRGSGIGLALVKNIAEAHGGGVTVESEQGAGTVMRLWIPAPPAVQ